MKPIAVTKEPDGALRILTDRGVLVVPADMVPQPAQRPVGRPPKTARRPA